MKSALLPCGAAFRASLLVAFSAFASAGELKVDLDKAAQSNVTQSGYVGWGIADTTGTATRTFAVGTDNIAVSFRRAGAVGTGLTTNWFKAGAQGNVTTRLVNDGLTVAPANLTTGGQIEMKISGLAAGHHTLLTYHNSWDNPATNSFSPIDIYLNGTLVVDNLVPSNRAATNAQVPTAYLEFDVTGPSDVVVVLFASETGTAATEKNVWIDAFEIDTPNSIHQAQNPVPADNDEHVDADTGTTTLSWAPAANAARHDVYFGTDKSAVTAATHTSPLYRGIQIGTTYALSGLTSAQPYYWRIDEVDAAGNVTKGVVWAFWPRHLAFPGAEGYGRFARGGRGGRVVTVTTLDDYQESQGETPIPGSLRYAVEKETGSRTIVFNVSGLITLRSRLTINSNSPYLTMAGQTAPGKGVCIREWTMGLSGGRDVIVRFMRTRPGNISGTTIDGMGMQGSNYSILDHCSISWSIDEAFSSRSANNITLQRTLIAEALNVAGHQNYPPGTKHGYAASIGGDIGSFHHNLLAHNYGRNWSLAGGLDGTGNFAGRLDITDNVVYNWGHRATDGGAHQVNFVNNYYKPGAATDFFYALNAQYDNFPGTQQYYFAGNLMPGHFDETNETAGRTTSGFVPTTYPPFVDTPFFPAAITTQSAGDAYKQVLSDVGATEPTLDDHDVRVVEETRDGTYHYVGSVSGLPGMPDTQDDVGGWENYPEVHRAADFDSDGDGLPDWWEQLHGTNAHSAAGDFSDSNADPDGDGYTNLEDYLNWLAEPHFTIGGDVQIDLAPFTRGYTASPQHMIGAVVNGSAQLASDGHTVTFHPSAPGLAQLTHTVTDANGSSMTRVINFRVLDHPVVTLGNLSQMYDGTPKSVTVTTDPAGLNVQVAYNGSPTPPTLPGSYVVTATVADLEYVASVTDTLTIGMTALVRHAPSISGQLDGSLQTLGAESFALNGNALVSGDLLVRGTPTVDLNGHPTLGGTQDGTGDPEPTSYAVTLNGNAMARYVIRRVDPIAMPSVTAPPAPTGTRDVALNSRNDDPGDFATIRNLTLNGNAGEIAVPAGTYGQLTSNGVSTLVFGRANATTPDVYNLQGLTINGRVKIVGPVRIILASSLTVDGKNTTFGDAAHPRWLALAVSSGGVALNGGATLIGTVMAPTGAVTINASSTLKGTVVADGLTINGDGLLSSAP